MAAMTLTASPRRLPSTVAAAGTVDVTTVYGSGDTAVRALDRVTVELPAAPLAPKLRWYAGRRYAPLSARALGPATREVA
jgi:hypothetical protein